MPRHAKDMHAQMGGKNGVRPPEGAQGGLGGSPVLSCVVGGSRGPPPGMQRGAGGGTDLIRHLRREGGVKGDRWGGSMGGSLPSSKTRQGLTSHSQPLPLQDAAHWGGGPGGRGSVEGGLRVLRSRGGPDLGRVGAGAVSWERASESVYVLPRDCPPPPPSPGSPSASCPGGGLMVTATLGGSGVPADAAPTLGRAGPPASGRGPFFSEGGAFSAVGVAGGSVQPHNPQICKPPSIQGVRMGVGGGGGGQLSAPPCWEGMQQGWIPSPSALLCRNSVSAREKRGGVEGEQGSLPGAKGGGGVEEGSPRAPPRVPPSLTYCGGRGPRGRLQAG